MGNHIRTMGNDYRNPDGLSFLGVRRPLCCCWSIHLRSLFCLGNDKVQFMGTVRSLSGLNSLESGEYSGVLDINVSLIDKVKSEQSLSLYVANRAESEGRRRPPQGDACCHIANKRELDQVWQRPVT